MNFKQENQEIIKKMNILINSLFYDVPRLYNKIEKLLKYPLYEFEDENEKLDDKDVKKKFHFVQDIILAIVNPVNDIQIDLDGIYPFKNRFFFFFFFDLKKFININ